MSKIVEKWKKDLNRKGFKFFVLKAEDFLDCLSEEEVEQFNYFLFKHEKYRISKGKTPSNSYYVINRDDVPHLKTKEEFFEAVGYKVNK
jgi:hypothetical protein